MCRLFDSNFGNLSHFFSISLLPIFQFSKQFPFFFCYSGIKITRNREFFPRTETQTNKIRLFVRISSKIVKFQPSSKKPSGIPDDFKGWERFSERSNFFEIETICRKLIPRKYFFKKTLDPFLNISLGEMFCYKIFFKWKILSGKIVHFSSHCTDSNFHLSYSVSYSICIIRYNQKGYH